MFSLCPRRAGQRGLISVLDQVVRLHVPRKEGRNIHSFLALVAGWRATGKIAAYPAPNGTAGPAGLLRLLC